MPLVRRIPVKFCTRRFENDSVLDSGLGSRHGAVLHVKLNTLMAFWLMIDGVFKAMFHNLRIDGDDVVWADNKNT